MEDTIILFRCHSLETNSIEINFIKLKSYFSYHAYNNKIKKNYYLQLAVNRVKQKTYEKKNSPKPCHTARRIGLSISLKISIAYSISIDIIILGHILLEKNILPTNGARKRTRDIIS
jgi:hypothetical protein